MALLDVAQITLRISGVYRPQRGSIRFAGQDITRLSPAARTRLGIARTFQNIALFKGMTVLDNLLIGRHSHQKRVERARARAVEPKLLFLDEPMAGMNAEEKEDMARFILDVNEERGTTIVMIEHDMGVVMDLSHHVVVLNFGQQIAAGAPEHVQRSREVQLAYLGGQVDA